MDLYNVLSRFHLTPRNRLISGSTVSKSYSLYLHMKMKTIWGKCQRYFTPNHKKNRGNFTILMFPQGLKQGLNSNPREML